MVTDYYLQNRTFEKNRDIECGGKMVVGSDVLPIADFPFISKKYLYTYQTYASAGLNTTETEKSQPTGTVIVKSGNGLLLEAKDRITFESGFKVEHGATFKAVVDGSNPNSRSSDSQLKCGQIVTRISDNKRTFTVSNTNEETHWQMVGYKSNFQATGDSFSIPEGTRKGQYAIEANTSGCEIPTIVVSVSQEKEKKKKEADHQGYEVKNNLIVSPNPADHTLKLKSNELLKHVEIFDAQGRKVESVTSNQYEILLDVSKYSHGAYLLHIQFKNGENETKKFIVSH